MWRKILLILIFCFGSSIAMADLTFESGYNVFDETDGYHSEVFVINDAHLDVFGGEIGTLLGFWGSSTGNIYDGQINWLWMDDNAVVNVYGGAFDVFALHTQSISVYLLAFDVTYHPDGGLNDLPWFEGTYYLDQSSFSITFEDAECVPLVTIVPEPATVLLLAFGGLFLRRKS